MSNVGAGWFYAIGPDRHGPVDITALRQLLASGQIYPNTLVWREGMPNWVAAVTHPDLAIAAQQQISSQMPGAAPASAGSFDPATYAYAAPGQMLGYYGSPHATVALAGFWWRALAWLLDMLIALFAGCIVGGCFGFFAGVSTGGPPNELMLRLSINGIVLILTWLYYALMESSAAQGTVGKLACGMRVTDLNGNRITFGRATGRFSGRILSGVPTLGVGFILAGVTQRKQALHDMMAGCLVVRG